ncbi:GNAT family N-acetyltransferase [Acidimicrobiia bacterium EGI L10123]|uniref:GNAT family N-acetyltransferase n=1 Tax=Salinilacustrithrix flava TaxID=2957203 RepID=UPI003D7C15BB|nr:GNAT family N-acetyltransferase [Acidimicrobiia bacterium EGI L10123]
MTATDTVTARGVRMRVRPWRGRSDTAELSSVPAGAMVPPGLVALAVERARTRGYATVVTPALPVGEWRAYIDAGFSVREELHLLGHDLLDLPDRRAPERRVRTRRVHRRDRDSVLAIDRTAFDPFWRLDADALEDAVRATPSTRFRLDRDGHGYALTGRAGDRGYLQRLAVDPGAQGSGLGSALVVDGLWWLRRWRVREALVNTQTSNERAVALYERLGFRRRSEGLAVLELDVASHPAPPTPDPGPVP